MNRSSGDSGQSSSMSYIKSSTFKSVFELCDVVSVIVCCRADTSIMLIIESSSNEYWIPSIKVTGLNSWLGHLAKDLLNDIFGCNASVQGLMRLNKLWLPSPHKFSYICHAIFTADVTLEMKKKSKSPFGKYRGKIRWCNLDDILKLFGSNVLKSPEILDFIAWINRKPSAILNPPSDHETVGSFMEISENVIVSGKNTIYEQIVEAAGIDRHAQEVLYKEFVLMSYPAIYLTFTNFAKFVVDLGWTKEEATHLYRSADIYGRGGISFREFLYFLSATEPGTSHGGGPAELRCRYIFRYLDTDKNNLLKRDEMKNLVILVRKSRKMSLDPTQVEKELVECYQSIGIAETYPLTMSDFLRAVGELKVRGTSQIFRAPNSVQKIIKDIIDRDAKSQEESLQPVSIGGYAKCPLYELGIHSVKIGNMINVEQLWSIENATSCTSTLPVSVNETSRKVSTDKFHQNSKSNELLRSLRKLYDLNKKTTCYIKLDSFVYNWGTLDSSVIAKNLASVCSEVKAIFLKERRLLDIPSPVYILGDLHGNFTDLLNFERILWHVGPALCPCNLLFLGDYVDRGYFSFEVISYLFSYKIQSPKKVFLLRGNHEIRRVQQQWTFEKECRMKFGEKLGPFIFNSINDAMDCLPLAAVIDGRVFCCHGGIPPPWLCPVVSAINDIPSLLNDPQEQSSLAWELMWNDPIRAKTVTDKIAMELLANEGFAVNAKRGTAHIFSVEALEKFLASNGFTHLVRAHEVVEAGFYLQQKGHLLTVFSSSKYCGGVNTAACILADQGKIRILRLDSE
ncbi:uncharacterized protein LOC103312510 [Tribolium castaneum]|uniref:Serine/threonine-protein phosphatase n=1 Tax=Tribolium castaneum TaxID=7070 RepID=A0A139WJZ1_TRICA|nr:PREDICTED: uncharacterized protein LOC103312510 [Tribolium castaneum]KYB28233.1 hypothetical protein TcasGA2_TC032676 [Tribolium castaneum]|eukprot:XP_008191517.1 PREDICTED: uncharacterized protein LOC103312510 [Tribolium castaneum]